MTVRAPHSTLDVTIHDSSISLTRTTEIASPFEVVRRDQATGEILSGGNTYVDIAYALARVMHDAHARRIPLRCMR